MEEQKKAIEKRNIFWFLISYGVICIGSGLSPLLYFGPLFLGLLGISFIVLGSIGIVAIRKKTSALKRTNPELYEVLRAEAQKRAQKRRAREVHFSDFPLWIIALLAIVAVIGFIGEIGFLPSDTPFTSVLTVLIILFLAYYFYYEHKIRKKKKNLNFQNQ